MKLRFRLGPVSYPEAVSTLHCALENGANLHVNEHQKNYKKKRKKKKKKEEEECQIAICLLRAVRM